ncbi:hypothetical protein CHU93_00825 [Sandarakinorhabdus cyanobacteriorum]|uniref:TonB-dependent receptor n=2 Tax=Sandarakinorhabdus cyanobacteriorum TaxID=1981098 RepID=A0A255Z5J6_9SPHN|nr:hypothetical protein CHU93_00825 [Sandarakinorhabdus cyanobacteriorum]
MPSSLMIPLILLANAAAEVPPPASVDEPDIVVTATRRSQNLQDVPVAITAIAADRLEATGSFNLGRVVQLIPSVNFTASNPRNSAITIRGLGAPFGLTNDGIEQGVGLYIDGVYYSRPAAATFDFVDIEQIEVLRGPQGTLYGKNTTAGAVNIRTKAPSFTPEGRMEASAGNLDFVQVRGTVSGPITQRLAARAGLSFTSRAGTIRNVRTGLDENQQRNFGLRGSLLWRATDNLDITLAGDHNQQNPRCCVQVFVRAAPTLRAANRQFASLAAASGYAPPSLNPFDRLVDTGTPHAAKQFFGGAALTLEWDAGPGKLTAITAYRYWNWYPSNDRDFTGLPITTVSANFSRQQQYTQEIRWASSGDGPVSVVGGVFAYRQTLRNDPLQEQGSAAALWLLGPGNNPALLDGLRQTVALDYTNDSLAGFGQIAWKVNDRLKLQGGLRLNWDRKDADYRATVTGGLVTSDPVLIARKNSVLGPQAYVAKFNDFNVSGDATISYDLADDVMAYVTYARNFKPGGVNLGGLPTDSAGNPLLGAATIRPERVNHYEAGLKTRLWDRALTLNLAAFRTDISDYQTTVVNAQIGVLRGYLANAAAVRVQGLEAELSARLSDAVSVSFNGTYLDGTYRRFTDAPPPLELTGGPQVVDVSGQRLPGISRWAGTLGIDVHPEVTLFGHAGRLIAGTDVLARTGFSSSPTPSAFLNAPGYVLVNGRLGWQSDAGVQVFAWVRNAFQARYFDLLTAAPGGSGLVAGLPGDQRTGGITIGYRF